MIKIRRSLLVAFLSLCPAWVDAQEREPPSLDHVEELARQGRTSEARDVLTAWWAAEGAEASRRDTQRGLWLRGILTTDPAEAEFDFQRLVIEYPGGLYADRALLRLAQGAYAAGDSATAAAYVARLAREYPATSARREAEAWLATAGPVPPRAGGQARADTASHPETAPTVGPDAPAASGAGSFTVQLGAFRALERAEGMVARLGEEGIEARLARIPGSDLIRVRVGRFDSLDAANAVLWQLRDRGFTANVARDADREERVVR